MDRFREMEVFVAVADAGGFATAARRLGASAPTVTRLIGDLEARLGARLLARTTRQVRLTEAGRRFEADARAALAALAEAEAGASGAAAEPRGRLRLSAPVVMGRLHLAPILRDWLTANPGVSAEALLLDRFVDLIGEDIDVALRIGALEDSGLRAIRVGEVRRVVVAAPDLAARLAAVSPRENGAITPRALQGWPLISRLGAPREWTFGGRAPRRSPRLALSDVAACLEAAEAGWGVARCLSYQSQEAIRAGRLVELPLRTDEPPLPVQLVHAEGRRPSAALRGFLDAAAPRLRAALGDGARRGSLPDEPTEASEPTASAPRGVKQQTPRKG